jgi:hypothetical protein
MEMGKSSDLGIYYYKQQFCFLRKATKYDLVRLAYWKHKYWYVNNIYSSVLLAVADYTRNYSKNTDINHAKIDQDYF